MSYKSKRFRLPVFIGALTTCAPLTNVSRESA
jgi:hypothetical protein